MANPKADTVLIVDDDPGQRSLFTSFLSGQGIGVTTAASGDEALAAIETHMPALLLSDVRMPGMTGLELLEHVRTLAPTLPVLLVTAYADVRDAVGAIQGGAIDYLEKPVDLDQLLDHVRQVLGGLPPNAGSPDESFDTPPDIVMKSEAMQRVCKEAQLVAPSEARVLITGESGAGKEVVADLIHRWSPRAGGPLVKVNCAAIPETLLESELFGHERGAFTGATNARVGRFEQARKGTILLDEIAEMSPALQAKLLRVTQNGAFCRVGSNQEFRTDARVLAATNRDLDEEVAAGRFREDLYYRLNVFEIYLPPLRERQADIVALANHFAAFFSEGKPRLSPGTLQCVERHPWPGNVRELRNAMERAVLLSRGGVILPEHLPKRVQQPGAEPVPEPTGDSGSRMEDIERTAILQALREHDFNRTETARALGISRRALTYKVRTYREQGFSVDSE